MKVKKSKKSLENVLSDLRTSGAGCGYNHNLGAGCGCQIKFYLKEEKLYNFSSFKILKY